MKITACLVLFVMSFTWRGAHAEDSPCNASPYGDTVQNLVALGTKFSTLSPARITHELQIACYAKFVKADRTSLDLMNIHAAGISDAELQAESTTAIAAKWFDAAFAVSKKLGNDPSDPGHWISIPPLPADAVKADAGHSNCSVGGFVGGEDKIVYIHASEASCQRWVGQAILLGAIGPTEQEIRQAFGTDPRSKAAASRAEAAQTGSIFAIFMCFRAVGQCQMYGAPRVDTFGHVIGATTFESLYECQEFIHRLGPLTHDSQGRFEMPNNMYYECRSKHVESWEPAH